MVTALGPTPLGYGAGAYAPTPTLEAYAPGALGPTLLGYGAGAYAPTPTPEVSNSCIHAYVSSPTIQPHNESGVPPLPTLGFLFVFRGKWTNMAAGGCQLHSPAAHTPWVSASQSCCAHDVDVSFTVLLRTRRVMKATKLQIFKYTITM